jgi:carbon starvation protein
LFGLANQLLSVIALCLCTTILIKMQKTRYVFITVAPLLFMCAVTFSAGYFKIFSSDPRLGFLSGAQSLKEQAASIVDPTKAQELLRQVWVWQFDTIVAGFFMLFVFLIVVGSAAQWWQLIRGKKPAVLRESEFIPVGQLETIG